MQSRLVLSLSALLAGLALAATAVAQQPSYTGPSLLPLPQTQNRYPLPTSAGYSQSIGAPPPPAEQPPQPQETAPAAEPPATDMYGQYGSCASCGTFHGPGPCPYGGGVPGRHLSWGRVFGSLHGIGLPSACDAPAAPLGGRCGWFAGAAGLVMTRDNGNPYAFSFENSAATEAIQLLNVRDVEMEWAGGVEARVGHYYDCGLSAWELVYWGLYPGRQEATLLAANFANPLGGILNWDQISIFDPTAGGGAGANVSADNWVDNADAHRLQRDFEFHNVELNLIHFLGAPGDGCCPPRFSYNWGLGVRYFRFTEELLFSAKEGGSGIVFDNSIDQLDYLVDVENNLIGVQLNADGRYALTSSLSLTFGTKLGLYGNHIDHKSVIQSAGNYAFVNNGPLTGSVWNIQSTKDDVAFLGELNVGMLWQISSRWAATLGYRAVAITGVALPSNQIYSDLRGVNDAVIVDSNGSLILHGGYAGVQWNY